VAGREAVAAYKCGLQIQNCAHGCSDAILGAHTLSLTHQQRDVPNPSNVVADGASLPTSMLTDAEALVQLMHSPTAVHTTPARPIFPQKALCTSTSDESSCKIETRRRCAETFNLPTLVGYRAMSTLSQ
jgi:hypothetical protein